MPLIQSGHGPGNHRADGTRADHALIFKLDHQDGATEGVAEGRFFYEVLKWRVSGAPIVRPQSLPVTAVDANNLRRRIL